MRPLGTRRQVAVWGIFWWLVGTAGAGAHDIPSDLVVRAFLKPEGDHIRLLVRVPLAAIIDVDYPKRGPGLVDLTRVDPVLREAATRWIADYAIIQAGNRRLGPPALAALRISLPSDQAFTTYERSLALTTGGTRLPPETELQWSEGVMDALYEYPVTTTTGTDYAVQLSLERFGIRLTTALEFLLPDGRVRAFALHGDAGLVRLDPRWHQAAGRFVAEGVRHILSGPDHLLFLLCLVIPLRRLRPLAIVVTAFTLAHSVTLIAAAYELGPRSPWFPTLVETLIAGSIVVMAVENVLAPRLERRWAFAFLFGLVHGFGFSFALRETLQFAGAHQVTSLLSFNVGVELGQLGALALMVPALAAVFRAGVPERAGTIVLSAFVAHTGWHWTMERAAGLTRFAWHWPAWDAALLAEVLRWAIGVLAAVAVVWFVNGWRRAPADITS